MILKKNKKYKDFIKGILAEYYVMFYLIFKGYKPIRSRYRISYGEIDLIMKHKKNLIAIEVKYRKNMDDALYSLKDNQKQRIRSSLEYISKDFSDLSPRCDMCAVDKNLRIKHIKNAF